MLNGHDPAPKVVVGGSLSGLFNALVLAGCLIAGNRDAVEALRRWEPAELDYGEQLRLGTHSGSPGSTGLFQNKPYSVLLA